MAEQSLIAYVLEWVILGPSPDQDIAAIVADRTIYPICEVLEAIEGSEPLDFFATEDEANKLKQALAAIGCQVEITPEDEGDEDEGDEGWLVCLMAAGSILTERSVDEVFAQLPEEVFSDYVEVEGGE